MTSILSPEERFFDKIEMEPNSGCWLWTATQQSRGDGTKGYGQFTVRPKKWLAHRWAAKFLGGLDIDGKVVRHICENNACVNPDHLTTGSQKENMQDAWRSGRIARGANVGSSKITEDIVREIRARKGERIVDLAKEFGITHQNVSLIQNKKSWSWVD